MVINELHLLVRQEQTLDRQRAAEKARLIRHIITLQKGDQTMLKVIRHYGRYALSLLVIVGFKLASN